MVEIDNYFWDCLRVLKEVFDHDEQSPVLASFKDREINGAEIYEVTVNAVEAIFQDTRCYYNDEKELESYVFFDPLITDFWKLCEEYEKRTGTSQEKSSFRDEMFRAINSALYFDEYSYGIYSYEDTERKNGCRLVLVIGSEFFSLDQVPGALCEVYEAFEKHLEQLKEALAELDQRNLIELPKRIPCREEAA